VTEGTERRDEVDIGNIFGGGRWNRAKQWGKRRVNYSSADACALYEGYIESKCADLISIRASLILTQAISGDQWRLPPDAPTSRILNQCLALRRRRPSLTYTMML
jgi:hypothetical protein